MNSNNKTWMGNDAIEIQAELSISISIAHQIVKPLKTIEPNGCAEHSKSAFLNVVFLVFHFNKNRR